MHGIHAGLRISAEKLSRDLRLDPRYISISDLWGLFHSQDQPELNNGLVWKEQRRVSLRYGDSTTYLEEADLPRWRKVRLFEDFPKGLLLHLEQAG